MSVTHLAPRAVISLESTHGPRADAGICQAEESLNACPTNGMAQKFAGVADHRTEFFASESGNSVVSRLPAEPAGGQTPAAESADKRRLLTHRIGTEVAKGLGWNPGDYTERELAALGERLIADYALHGDEASGSQMLVAIAKAAGKLDPAALAQGDHEKAAGQIAEFLHAEFSVELAVSHTAIRLSQLHMPTRRAVAGDLLKRIGIDPEKRIYRPDAYREPANFRGKRIQDRPSEHYINADTLSAWDLRYMTRRELSDNEVAAMQAQLPASLKDEFDQRFDAYTRNAADLSTTLIDAWLNWVAKKHGVDLAGADIELATGTLQYSRHTVLWTGRGGWTATDKPQLGFPTIGYVATIRAAGKEYRYFFSTRDGSARPLPPGVSFDDWGRQRLPTVFGVAEKNASKAQAAPGLLEPPDEALLLSPRAILTTLARGRRDQLAQWLTPVLHDRFTQAREEARGQTSLEGMTDFLLDFIPYRSAIVALAKGDLDQAKFLIFMDTVFFLIPTLSSLAGWKKGLAKAARDMGTLPRLIGEELATRGVSGIREALADVPKLRESIKAALTSLNATSAMADGLRPLDAQAMAAALKADFPAMADALEETVEREYGPRILDGEWQVPPASRAAGDDGLIEALPDIQATDREGNTLALQSYGDDSGRAYTQVSPVTKQPTGAVLVADSEGRLYQSLPVKTLERYCVRDPDVLRGLGAQRAAGDGTFTFGGKTYARIVDDYIEILPEHGSTVDRPAWRVVPPRAAKRDIATHRLFYDKERSLWRGADLPELKGGSGRGMPPPLGEAYEDFPHGSALGRGLRGSAAHGNAFRELLLSRITGASVEREIPAVREFLGRLETHPRAKTILRAMEAYYELHDEVPEIVLVNHADSARPRPLLEQPVRGSKWHLDLNSLNVGSLDEAAGEVAAVYNNMTGILQGENPFAAAFARGEPRLDRALEKSWREWMGYEIERMQGAVRLPMAQQALVPERYEALIQNLRSQLREARCYGGLDRDTFMAVLENRFEGEVPGLSVDLSEQDFMVTETGAITGADRLIITSIPPLPEDVYALNISDRLIRDWGGLPRNLKVLKAANTGGSQVLERLPTGLVELDVSRNGLDEWPANLSAEIKKLTVDGNRFATMPRFAEGLQELSISENRLEHLAVEHLPSSLKVLRASGNRFRELPDMSGLGLQWLDLSRNAHALKLPRLAETLETLYAADCGLTELPAGLPSKLEALYVGDNRLVRLPDDLPRRLYVLDLRSNRLERLSSGINGLTYCDIYVHDNPLLPDGIPSLAAGASGPRIHH